SFFCIPQRDDLSPPALFHGLYIASKHDICQKYMGKYAVIFCDFKNITGGSWEEMFASFRVMVSNLYKEWYQYLGDSLDPEEKRFFDSIRLNTAVEYWIHSLNQLTGFLAQKCGRKVMVFIDEYEAPNNRAYELDFFDKVPTVFFGGVLLMLLKTNADLEYALLTGVTPVKAGWYRGVNNIAAHALDEHNSIFAGMVMFTEPDVLRLRTLSKVSHP
ncbi:hypothetical protein M378DRAFT_157725, partial [Amanita muscaria Koide BX008]